MFRNSILTLLTFVLITGCGKESVDEAQKGLNSRGVFQGINATNPSVGFIVGGFTMSTIPPSPVNLCTATVIKNRCVLTAAHCAVPRYFVRTDDYSTDTNRQFFQVLRGEKKIQIIGNTLSDAQTSQDLAMYWLAPKGPKTSLSSPPINPVVGWSPLNLALGIFPTSSSILTILGFGKFDDSPNSITTLRKRSGGMAFGSALNWPGAGNGGLIRLNRQAPTYRGSCAGDSGGPLIASGTLYGVGSTGAHAQCANTSVGAEYTSLTNGNNTWITQKMNTDICVPKLSVSMVNAPGGIIRWTRGGVTTNCGGSAGTGPNCVSSLDGRVVTLTAVPNANWRFTRWENFSAVPGSCPCANSTNPTCIVNPTTFELPNYMNTFSETASCIAQFAPNYTPTPLRR